MAGPGNEAAGGARGHGHLRASHADRERAIEWLKAAFVQGRLAKDELDSRVGQAFASRTYTELAKVTADLPAGSAVAQPRSPAPAQGWLTMRRAVVCSACIWLVPTALASVIGWVAEGRFQAGPVLIVSFFAFFMATVAAGTMIGEVWDKNKRSRGQLPHQSGREQGGQALEGGQNGASGRPAAWDHSFLVQFSEWPGFRGLGQLCCAPIHASWRSPRSAGGHGWP